MQQHAKFLQDMALSLKDSEAPCPSQVVEQLDNRQSRRFDIYRNNRAVSLVENLKATYPVVCKLVGEEFFNAAARQYIDQVPPTGPVMAEYGGEFGQFLMKLPNTQGIAYIQDIAQLEWSRLQAYHAKDAQVLPLDTLLNIAPEEYETLCFKTHPSLRLVSSQWPIGSMWEMLSTDNDKPAASLNMNNAERVAVVRPTLDVIQHVLTESCALLLSILSQGKPLVMAVEQVTEQYPDFDPGADLQSLIAHGVFASTYREGNISD